MDNRVVRIQTGHSVRRLEKRRYGYSRRQLCGVPRRNMYPLWRWMRGPSGFSKTLGLVYGVLFGLLAGIALTERANDLSRAGVLAVTLWLIIFFVVVGVWAAQTLSGLSIKSSDPFYRYGRRCRDLIGVTNYTPRTLDTRKDVAKVVGLWVSEAARMSIDAQPYQGELEAIVSKKILTEADLERIAELGREAALAPLRGEVDMLALTPQLLPRRLFSRVRPTFQWLLGSAATVISIAVAIKELTGR